MLSNTNNLDKNRIGFLKACEMILKYHHLLAEREVHMLVMCVVNKITDSKEYADQFRALSNQYTKRRIDRMTCAVLCLKDQIGVDCARIVANLV